MDMKGSVGSFEAKQKVCTDSGLEFMVLLNFKFFCHTAENQQGSSLHISFLNLYSLMTDRCLCPELNYLVHIEI